MNWQPGNITGITKDMFPGNTEGYKLIKQIN